MKKLIPILLVIALCVSLSVTCLAEEADASYTEELKASFVGLADSGKDFFAKRVTDIFPDKELGVKDYVEALFDYGMTPGHGHAFEDAIDNATDIFEDNIDALGDAFEAAAESGDLSGIIDNSKGFVDTVSSYLSSIANAFRK